MSEWNTDQLVDWDKRFLWHPVIEPLIQGPPACVFGRLAHYEPFETGVVGLKRS